MRCQFLREAQVKYCQASAIKKMILRLSSDVVHERCSSSEYRHCPFLKQHHEEQTADSRCPSLHELLVQYCAASPTIKYVPYSESSFMRCGNNTHQYCELYCSVASPDNRSATLNAMMVDGIAVPESLEYTANHFWVDRTDEKNCIIGIDGFLARVLCRIDALDLISSRDSTLPTVVLSVRTIELPLMFPVPLHITRTNTYLRADVQKLVSHPYSTGWLFEGNLEAPERSVPSSVPSRQFIQGKEAAVWMAREIYRFRDFIQHRIIPQHFDMKPLMADGGSVVPDVFDYLTKEDVMSLYNEFFLPNAVGR